MSKDEKYVKIMADLLKQGLTLTEYACPVCSSPLFRRSGENLWCAKCKKSVIVVREGEEKTDEMSKHTYSKLESTILKKIQKLENQLVEETNPKKLEIISKTLSTLLTNLEKIRNLQR